MIERQSSKPTPSMDRSGWSIALAVIALSLVAGYGIGAYKHGVWSNAASASVAPDTGSKAALRADSTQGNLEVTTSATVDTATVVTTPPVRVDTVYLGETENPDLIAPQGPGYQTVVPPEEPFVPIQPRPSDPQLIEMLNGQKLLLSHTLLGDRIWTIEPGEITEFAVIASWEDPAQVSWGVRVKFAARDDGKGIRVSGLLRFYGDGGEGNGFMFRDFLPDGIERFGRW